MKPSLKGRLRWLMALVIAGVTIPLAILGYRRAVQEMNELADGRLAQAARTVETLVENPSIAQAMHASMERSSRRQTTLVIPVRGSDCLTEGASCELEVGFQVASRRGELWAETQNLKRFTAPTASDLGFEDIKVEGEDWRTYTTSAAGTGDIIRVAERHDSRAEITQMLRVEHGLSLFIELPILMLLMGWAVRRALQPLDVLTDELSRHSPGNREPVVLDAAPTELSPVLSALNGFLDRSVDALEREQRFAADAAHELRTPLAGAMAHLHNARMASDWSHAATSIAKAQHGLASLARRIEQLLILAGLDAGAASEQRGPVDLVELIQVAVEELAPLIAGQDADLDFSWESANSPCFSGDFLLQGHAAALSALLRNLIENALRHIPKGGAVSIHLTREPQRICLDVIDNGPGIPAPRREAVFARFHRESGSETNGHGLGLSIVMRAAELHEAAVELRDAPTAQGLWVHVTFPVQEMMHEVP
ncbi:MAG: two-component sensor histidine kinase [Burkholderiaceae bacterium]|nr:MAG: two-component sensor histidine kinase [Burkholderiaceae bacterium]